MLSLWNVAMQYTQRLRQMKYQWQAPLTLHSTMYIYFRNFFISFEMAPYFLLYFLLDNKVHSNCRWHKWRKSWRIVNKCVEFRTSKSSHFIGSVFIMWWYWSEYRWNHTISIRKGIILTDRICNKRIIYRKSLLNQKTYHFSLQNYFRYFFLILAYFYKKYYRQRGISTRFVIYVYWKGLQT